MSLGVTDLLEYIPVCHQSSSDAKSMSCSIYSLPSRNVVVKQHVQVGQFDPLGQNTQCTSQNRLGERCTTSKYTSESAKFDIAGDGTVMRLWYLAS